LKLLTHEQLGDPSNFIGSPWINICVICSTCYVGFDHKSRLFAKKTNCSLCGGNFKFLLIETDEEFERINPEKKR